MSLATHYETVRAWDDLDEPDTDWSRAVRDLYEQESADDGDGDSANTRTTWET
jgi:hypothetical protein